MGILKPPQNQQVVHTHTHIYKGSKLIWLKWLEGYVFPHVRWYGASAPVDVGTYIDPDARAEVVAVCEGLDDPRVRA